MNQHIQASVQQLPTTTAFYYIISLLSIAFIIGLFNLSWSVRHTLRIKSLNAFNLGLIACTFFFLLNVVSVGMLPAVKFYYAENRIKAGNEFKVEMAIGTNLFNRITWAITTLIYLVLIQTRFNLIAPSARLKIVGKMLLFLSVLLWVPVGVVSTTIQAMNPMLSATNPQLNILIKRYDRAWDVWFVLIDFILGGFTILSIIRAKKSIFCTKASEEIVEKEREIKGEMKRNIWFWMMSGVSWIAIELVNDRKFGNDPTSSANYYGIMSASMVIPSALQFTFALLIMNNIRALFEIQFVNQPKMDASPSTEYHEHSPESKYSKYSSPTTEWSDERSHAASFSPRTHNQRVNYSNLRIITK